MGWVKINTDGSVLADKRCAAAGGLIRDENGGWIMGFAKPLGDVSITIAELLAAREGLMLAWGRRVPRVILELDSKVVVHLIRKADTECHPLGRIIEDCRSLLGRPWESRICHTLRDGNKCADALARMGHEVRRIWEEVPEFVLSLLEEDAM